MNDRAVFVWHGSTEYTSRVAHDPLFAADRVRKNALRGDAASQLGWAFMLLDGHGATRDPDAAFRWFQLAARSGGRDAINMVGRCHELGWGTPINLPMAAHCYRSAAHMGHAWAQFNLACLMLRDDGVGGDLADAVSLLARSARGGNAKAMNMLGRCCEEGWRGITKPAAARRWYARAGRGGCFRGAFHTARHLLSENKIDDAVSWLRRSIAMAPADFCNELGQLFAEHEDSRLRKISELARHQAHNAPQHPDSQFSSPAPLAQRSTSSPSARGGRFINRAIRKLTGAAGVLR